MAIEGNVGLAFGLVIAAGLCTCLGATLVFCTNLANHRVLAASLGASAGVMFYVSFVEIFTAKAVQSFVTAGFSNDEAMRYATFAFFTGVLATWLLGKLVHWLAHLHQIISKRRERRAAAVNPSGATPPAATAAATAKQPTCTAGGTCSLIPCLSSSKPLPASAEDSSTVLDVEQGSAAAGPAGLPYDAAIQLSEGPSAAGKDSQCGGAVATAAPTPAVMLAGCECCASSSSSSGFGSVCCCDDRHHVTELEIPKEENPELVAVLQADHHATDLARMGLLTGLAVALHNLPEGLATFVATLASPSAGIAIAVAIALHNVPEGVVVAMPIYYATGSKWKGFFWSFLSGVAEPVGGLIAYGILAGNGMSPLAFAVMFAFVAGMMVYISLRELLPTALRYDPEDVYVTAACLWGMVVMAASLLLFRA